MELQHAPEPWSRTTVTSPSERPIRLVIPAQLRTGLGCDVVGTSREHGERILDCLPRIGCVFADDSDGGSADGGRWWWVVPAGSHIGVSWPPSVTYTVGAHRADPSWTRARRGRFSPKPRLIHSPAGDSPYTPPIPLYFLACRLAGRVPSWSLAAGA
ncbi:hypothetical protein GCM10010372_18810 [Streptomyces tauricus]|uniref:Uncharacterized protein n=1 Tax=Streptomyces tauricus TaxID=68274 RepID=A0ABZ1JE65_9ACTN|nr:hypothetical protein [Streptomyces tauricus]MCW8095655.1 hypothetical protein [Streptomyces tauricus]GHA19367.1 hypothetical protein GCM10010372_18810 [Streptomyces tauricus]